MKIKHGTTRTVFIFSKFVVKIPTIYFIIGIPQEYFSVKRKNRKGLLEILVKWGVYHFLRGWRSNTIEITLYKKYKPKFFGKIYFSISPLFIVAKRYFGDDEFEKMTNFIVDLGKLDINFDSKINSGYYGGHDIYSNDWRLNNNNFILLDYGSNFGKLLAENKEKVEKILKNEFLKATS